MQIYDQHRLTHSANYLAGLREQGESGVKLAELSAQAPLIEDCGDRRSAIEGEQSMTDRETKVFEDRLRRLADRRGLILSKSRAREPGSLTYGGYHLVNQETGGIEFGYGNAGRNYAATLEDIEQYLSTA